MSDQPNVVCVPQNNATQKTIAQALEHFQDANFHHVAGLDNLPSALAKIETLHAAIAVGMWQKQGLQKDFLAPLYQKVTSAKYLPIIVVTPHDFDATELLADYATCFACYVIKIRPGWPEHVATQLRRISSS